MSRALTRGVPYWSPVVVIALALLALYYLWHILIVFIIAAFLAFVLHPIVDRLDRALPRVVSILLVYLLFLAVLATAISWLSPLVAGQFRAFSRSLPTYISQAGGLFSSLQHRFVALPMAWQNVMNRALAELQSAAVRVTREALPAVLGAAIWFVSLIIIPVLTFFMLLGSRGYARMILALAPRHSRPSIVALMRLLRDALWAFIRGESLLMLAVGTASGLGFYLIGMPYPIVFAVIAGLLEAIPNFGPTITFITVTLVGFAISPILAVKAAAVALVVQLLENSLLAPLVLAKAVDVAPITVALAVLIGGFLRGPLGVLVSIPLAVMIKVVLLYFYAQDSEIASAGKRCRIGR